MLCRGGSFVGNIFGLKCVYLDGKVVGDIFVEHVYLGPNAIITGNITCKSIQVSATAKLVGLLDVSMNNDISSNASQLYENVHFVNYQQLVAEV